MGIQNKDGALYFATGIDNTGLYSGKREAMGLLKAMAGEITSFDIFGGLGISAGVAFVQAAKESYNFEKQFQQSMYEVATLSSGIQGSLTEYMNSVIDMTREVPVLANESAKALYQIVSAGHDGADGMKILEVSSKAAVGGVTETATAADAITTILNAYNKNASEAEKVSDLLFTTAKSGKTTMGELGKSMSQAAPIAAAYGISIDEVLAATVSITKQGVPTAEAMTKIRAAIMGASNVLGDAAFQGRTFQEALQLVYEKAEGSTSKLKDLLGTDEALQAALMVTGKNAKSASEDLKVMGNAAGASEKAFQQMRGSAENQTKLLVNNIFAYLRPLGQGMLSQIAKASESINMAFKDGTAQEALENIGTLITTVTAALVGYKGSIAAVTIAKQIHSTIDGIILKQKAIEAIQLEVNGGLYFEEAASIAMNTSSRTLLTKAIWAQTSAQLKNAAAMLTNPYVLAAAAFALLGYSIYKAATELSTAEKAQRKFNQSLDDQKKRLDDLKHSTSDLINIIKDESSSQYDKIKAYKDLQRLMPNIFKNMDIEKLKLMDILRYNKLIAEEINRRERIGAKTIAVMRQNELDVINSKLDKYTKQQADAPSGQKASIIQKLQEEKIVAEAMVKLANDKVKEIDKIEKEVENKKTQKSKGDISKGKSYWEKQKQDAETALDAIDSKQRKLLNSGKFNQVDSKIVENYKKQKKLLSEADKELKVYPSEADVSKQAQALKEQTEQYKLLLSKQQLDKIRSTEDLQMQVDESRINAMKDGAEKIIAQMELNFEKEIQTIDRQKEDLLRKKIDDARDAFNSKPGKKKGKFNSSKIKLSDDESKYFESLKSSVNEKNSNTFGGLINQYQDYTDKRLSIEKKYDNDIRVLDEARKKATEVGNKDEVERIDSAKAEATKNKGKDLMALDYEKLKENPEYVRAFENLKYTSTETLNSLLSQLENAKATAAKVLSPDQLREYTSSIQSIMDELEQRNPFAMLAQHKEELAEAESELAEAQQELILAQEQEKSVKSGGKVESGVKSTSLNKSSGKIELSKSYLTEAQAAEKVAIATKKYNAAKDETTKKSAKVKESEKVTTEQIKKLGSAIKEVGDAIGGQTGAIIGMIGDIGTFAMTAVDGVKTAADTSATAISTVEKASVILGVISAAVQLATKVASFFAADYDDYNAAKENYESYVKVLDTVIDKQKELIQTMTGQAAIEASEKALDLITKEEEAARRLGKERLNAGASAGSHSIGIRIVENMSSQDWSDAKKALGAEFETQKLKGNRMQGLFDLSIEQLEKLQSEAPAFWGKLDGDVKDYLETIIETGKKTQEIIDATNEKFTGISFDSFKDNWTDALFDMNTSSQDLAKNFEEYLKKAIINSMIVDKYKGKINDLYEQFSKDAQSDNQLTQSEVDALKKEQQDITDKMLKEREELAKVFDFNSTDTSDSARSGGFQSMSQDVGNELNGRFTALQIAGEDIRAQNEQQTAAQLAIIEKLEFISNFSYEHQTEMCDIMVDILDMLGKIKKDTGNLYFIRESLEKIEDKIKNL